MESLGRSLKSRKKLPKYVDFYFEFKKVWYLILHYFSNFFKALCGPPAACSSSIKDK